VSVHGPDSLLIRLMFRPALVLIILLFASCQGEKARQTTDALLSLEAVVHATDSVNALADAAQVELRTAEVDRLVALAAQTGDTLSEKDARVLHRWARLAPQLRASLVRKARIAEECARTRSQLNALRADLHSGTMPVDSVQRHIDTEFQYVQSLNEAMNDNRTAIDTCMALFDELLPQVRVILDE